jgi:hypothetical protein
VSANAWWLILEIWLKDKWLEKKGSRCLVEPLPPVRETETWAKKVTEDYCTSWLPTYDEKMRVPWTYERYNYEKTIKTQPAMYWFFIYFCRYGLANASIPSKCYINA